MEKDLFYCTRYLCEYLDHLFDESDKKNGINSYHAIVCNVIKGRLSEGKDTIQKDIQEELLLSKAGTSDLINSMVNEGLISKSKDQIDKRKDVLVLTSKGDEFNKLTDVFAIQIQKEVLKKLTNKEAETLISLLSKLVEKIKGGNTNEKEN